MPPLVRVLEEADLDGFYSPIEKASIVSLSKLKKHSLSELPEKMPRYSHEVRG